MAYEGIDRKRFARLLEWGCDDGELRAFYTENKSKLILGGAKVQNLPHGKAERIKVLVQGLPSQTDRVVQKWFSENLTMLDPEPVDKLVADLRLYEEAGEIPPEDETKRLARSCLVHLFAANPHPELMIFLRPVHANRQSVIAAESKEETTPIAVEQTSVPLSTSLGQALIAFAEGRDPDELLSALPPQLASFVSGLQAVRTGSEDDLRLALDGLKGAPEMSAQLSEYSARSAAARRRKGGAPRGLELLTFARPDSVPSMDFARDEVIAVCTRDSPETAVFLYPIALRTANGSWIDLSQKSHREGLFYDSGDLIAFPGGRENPRQPRRGEIGLWKVAENKGSGTGHRTRFHIASDKVPVYEVRSVPFASTDYDSVREYIKDQVERRASPMLGLCSLSFETSS